MRLEGMFTGASAFLVGSNPALLNLDLRLMKMPGVWSLAINNAAIVVEPNAFIALDDAHCFNFNIFANPKIMKFLDYEWTDSNIEGERLCRFPNTMFFELTDRIQEEDFCTIEGSLVHWSNTFFTALHLLYRLGFSNIYMIGCVFDIDKEKQYAYDQKLSDELIKRNSNAYSDAVNKMRTLAPRLYDEGLDLCTCHEGTGLDGIVRYVKFEEAIGDVSRKSGSIVSNEIVHCVERR